MAVINLERVRHLPKYCSEAAEKLTQIRNFLLGIFSGNKKEPPLKNTPMSTKGQDLYLNSQTVAVTSSGVLSLSRRMNLMCTRAECNITQ